MLAQTDIAPETIKSLPKSLTGWQWISRECDERAVLALSQKLGLPEVLARIMVSRGVTLEEAEHFLSPSLKASMPDPSHLLDMDKAAERVAKAITSGEIIAVFGDYDVDGATSSALLARYFRALGNNPILYIPDRMTEGYGPNTKALLGLRAQGASVAITVDCGTLAFEPLEAAHKAGLDVIVVDHHQGEAKKPLAFAIVNPNRLDETSPHRHLAAVGVAFLLAAAINRHLRSTGFFANHPEPDLKQLLDLVALGTVCDVVPLHGVNRALVAQGLKIMAQRSNTGIRTLLDIAEVTEKPAAYHAGFVLGPRINAGGRVGRSDLGVRLLSTDDPAEALTLARELDGHNAERKAIEAMVQEQAMAVTEKLIVNGTGPFLVVPGQGWHPGVIGIVAGRLKDHFHMPVAVVAVNDGIGKASARSVSGFDIGAAVSAARDEGLLLAGGGHAMAAGFSVEENKLAALTEFLNKRATAKSGDFIRPRRLFIDADLNLAGATTELVELIDRLGPFGQGNPSVKVALRGVVNLKPELVGENHVRTLLIDRLSNARLSAIAFRAVGKKLGEALFSTRGQSVDMAVTLKINEWMGKRSVNVVIEDISIP